MATNTLNFSLIANNDASIIAIITDYLNAYINLTGATIKWGMFKNGVKVLEKSTKDGGIVIPTQTESDNLGKIYLNIDAEDTVDLETEFYYTHEFVITDLDSKSFNPVDVSTLNTEIKAGTVYLRRQYETQ